jgi:hypothetical protein
MKIRIILVALAAVTISVLAQSPSHATTTYPKVESWRVYANGTHGPSLQIQGGSDVWGVRKFAAEADRQVGGLRVYTSGTCATRPWATCVKVRVVCQPSAGWYGVARWHSKYQREVLLNRCTRKTNRYAVAAHEFTHVLGLGHHRQYGVVGRTPNVIHLSTIERRALNSAY